MQATGGATLIAEDRRGPASRRLVLGLLIGTALLVLVIDLVTKQLAVSRLADRDSVRLFGGAVYLLLVRNSGAAFSIAAGYTFIFSIIAIAVIIWISWMARRLRAPAWGVSLGLVLGGTVGNLVDRLFRAPGPFVGHVVDFISLLDAHGQGFAVFNAADSALCVGVGLAVLLEFTGRRRDGTRHSPGGTPSDDTGERSRSRGLAEASTPSDDTGERSRSRGLAEASTPSDDTGERSPVRQTATADAGRDMPDSGS